VKELGLQRLGGKAQVGWQEFCKLWDELLDKVRMSFYRHNIGPSGCLMTLKELVAEAGLRYRNNQTRHFEALSGKVPVGMVESQIDKKNRVSHKRRFLFRHDKDRAIQILQGDKSLQHLR
jgi:hypothetical protein